MAFTRSPCVSGVLGFGLELFGSSDLLVDSYFYPTGAVYRPRTHHVGPFSECQRSSYSTSSCINCILVVPPYWLEKPRPLGMQNIQNHQYLAHLLTGLRYRPPFQKLDWHRHSHIRLQCQERRLPLRQTWRFFRSPLRRRRAPTRLFVRLVM